MLDRAPYVKVQTKNVKYPIVVCLACLAFTFVMLVLSAPQARAEALKQTVLLKGNAQLVNDVITVGDIFKNTGEFSSHVLAPAPAVGRSMILGRSDLMRISRAFDLGWTPQSKFDKIVIKRATVNIDRSEIEKQILQTVRSNLNAATTEVEITTTLPQLTFNGLKKPKVEVDGYRFDIVDDSFEVTVNVTGQTGTEKSFTAAGRLYPVINIPVLTENLRNGDVIKAHHIQIKTIRQSSLKQNVALDKEDLIGMTPRRLITANRAINIIDVEKPTIVEKGELITMNLKNGPLNLTTKGRALDNGAHGDVVRVMNISSRRIVEGTVDAPQRVTVGTSVN